MKRFFACGLTLALCGLASSALADATAVPPAPQREPSAQPERRWYGWQTLTSDGISLAVLLTGISDSEGNLYGGTRPGADAIFTMGMAGYIAGGPALHLLHARPTAAVGSVLLRLTLPLLGGLIGSSLAKCPPPPPADYGNCGLGELVLGTGAGTLAAVAIDASALSWAHTEEKARTASRVSFAPVVSNDGKRAEVRVFGTF